MCVCVCVCVCMTSKSDITEVELCILSSSACSLMEAISSLNVIKGCLHCLRCSCLLRQNKCMYNLPFLSG